MLEFLADAGLEFDEAISLLGLGPAFEFGRKVDGGGGVFGVAREITDGGDDAPGIELPFDEEAISGQAAMKRTGSDSIKIRNDFAADAAESIEIEMSVADFERVKGPLNETKVAGKSFVSLEKFEEPADAAIAMRGQNTGHMGVEVGRGTVQADEGHGKADHGVAVEGAENLATGLMGDDKGDVGLGFKIGFAPDFTLDFDAAVEVGEGGAFADLDVGGHGEVDSL